MFKNKKLFVSLIIILAVISIVAVITIIIKSQNKGIPRGQDLNPSSTISSPSSLGTEGTAAVLTPTPSQALDISKLSSLIKNSYNSSISEKMTKDLEDTINEYTNPGYRITSFSVADVNNDNKNELVLTYAYPYDNAVDEWEYLLDSTNKYGEEVNYLCVYGFDSGTLNMLDRTELPVICTVDITDLIPDEKKEIFVMDKHMQEYPFYSMYVFNDNKLDKIDLESIGLNPQAQFVSVGYDTIYMGSRVTGGIITGSLYGGHTFKWESGSFVPIEEHFTDNRLLYKTQKRESFTGDISDLYKYDKKLPEIKNNEVTVENPYQLLSLIGPNRTIYLKPGIYDLGHADSIQNKYVSKEDIEFSINGVENLKIIGLGEERVEIAYLSKYSSVLKIFGSSNVSFENIMMGHGLETDECDKEVLGIEDSSGISIENCSFYGPGTHGIISKRVNQMNVNNSVIEECSAGGVVIDECKNINFNNISFEKNTGDILIKVDNSQNVVFDGVQDIQNDYDVFEKNNNSALKIKNVKKQ
ncbi:MAG TPA: right-handed parallel beta-helix repeat-containing protein [Pseudobacteroides sp.]|nr:right-handed parallel beta-helix repeat-containing protein [Pseudobacteroides sp.]